MNFSVLSIAMYGNKKLSSTYSVFSLHSKLKAYSAIKNCFQELDFFHVLEQFFFYLFYLLLFFSMYAIVKFVDRNDAPGIACPHWIYKDENLGQYPNVKKKLG